MLATRAFLILISGLLLGYAFLDKGFAYLGVRPLFIGEIVLVFGVLAFLLGGATFYVTRSRITVAILIFAAWGAFTTLPAVRPYGLEALRNSVLWSYSVFALIVACVVLRTGVVERTLDWYGRWIPWFLLWAPVGYLISEFYAGAMPLMPNSNVGILTLKGGDLAVHITGIAAFLALGLYRRFPVKTPEFANIKEYFCWGLVVIGILATGSRVRAGLVAFLAGMTVMMLLKPVNRATKFILPALVIVLTIVAANVSIPVSGGRTISPEQLYRNMRSVVAPESTPHLTDTSEWRIEWWSRIIDYTVFGDYFWTGKGYGVNLALDDGFFTGDPNRSPHNGFMTTLARSGVPGAILWLAVQLTIFFALVKRYFAARRAGYHVLGDVNLWLVTYWLAFIVNSCFDVYLEGPQGGIWFWCLVGYIIAVTLWQDTLLRPQGAAERLPTTSRYPVPGPEPAGFRD